MNEALTRSLETGAPQDWEQFLRAAHPIVVSGLLNTLARWSKPQPDQVDELVEQTFLELSSENCAALKRFRAECPDGLAVYLRAIACSVASDFLRSRDTSSNAGESTHRATLLGRIDRRLRAEEDRDRWIFWFYYRHGIALEAIAVLPSLKTTVREAGATIDRLTGIAAEEWTGRTVSLRASGPGAVEPSCLGVDEIAAIASGLDLSDAPELLDHIADCDRCGGVLRDTVAPADRVVAEGLRTASAEWQSGMAKRWSREARTGSPRYWLPAAAASLARRWMNRQPEMRRTVRTAAPITDAAAPPEDPHA